MDQNGFRLNDHAEIIHQPSSKTIKQETTRESEATKTIPAPDSRYSAYAGIMQDGRLVTDYRQACVTRAPPGTQFAVKQWTIHNTDEIIRISRSRQVQNTGQALGSARTELPPAAYQQCGTDKCHFYKSDFPSGIGLERIDPTPELFGTFMFSPDMNTKSNNKKHIQLNKVNEYGRNTSTRWVHLYQ
jgi:hypothetical protein